MRSESKRIAFILKKETSFILFLKDVSYFFMSERTVEQKEAICHLFLYTTVLFLTIFPLLSSLEMCLLGGSGCFPPC